MSGGFTEDLMQRYPATAHDGRRFRVLLIAPSTAVARVAYLADDGQFVAGERVQAWAQVEFCAADGSTKEEVLPIVQAQDPDDLRIVDAASYVGVWGDVGDMLRLRGRRRVS